MNASLTEASLRMLLALAGIVGVIVAAAWGARRLGLGSSHRRGAEDAVRILSRTSLDARKSVVVLCVRERVLVVGVTPTEIRLLTELAGEAAPAAEEPVTFASRFTKVLAETGILPNAH
ncbi:MAG: flagellar biosynthetic protein FliO [bacterium]